VTTQHHIDIKGDMTMDNSAMYDNKYNH